MKLHRWIVGWVVEIAGLSSFLTAQQGAATQTASAVPQLVKTPLAPTLSAADDPHQWLFASGCPDRSTSARAATWAAIWDCSRDGETPDRASRRCTSARKAIPIC